MLLGLQINSVAFFACKSDKKGTKLICRPNIYCCIKKYIQLKKINNQDSGGDIAEKSNVTY